MLVACEINYLAQENLQETQEIWLGPRCTSPQQRQQQLQEESQLRSQLFSQNWTVACSHS